MIGRLRLLDAASPRHRQDVLGLITSEGGDSLDERESPREAFLRSLREELIAAGSFRPNPQLKVALPYTMVATPSPAQTPIRVDLTDGLTREEGA